MQDQVQFWIGVGSTILVGFVFSPYCRDVFLQLSSSIPWRSINRIFLPRSAWLQAIQDRQPSMVIALNDGLVPAAILARNLSITDVRYVIHYVGDDGQPHPNSTLASLSVTHAGKTVLLIDDQIIRGRNMGAVYRHLCDNCGIPSNAIIRTALFRYRSPVERPPLDIEAPRTTRGRVKLAPWSYLNAHQRVYLRREE